MRIPTREEQARYGSLNAHDTQRFNVQERTPNASLQINADMFGAGQARAMAQGAHELQRGARQLAHWYRENELTKATETFTKYQESLNEDLYGENGIFTSKGEAALDAPKRANDLLKKRAEEFSKQAGNDLGQEFFMQKAAGFNQQLMPRATLHAENERNAWFINTHTDAMNKEMDEAVRNYANPEVFNQRMGSVAMHASLVAQKKGLPPESVQMSRDEAVSKGYMLVGQSLLAAGDVKGAMGILESNRLTGQDGIRFKTSIKQEQKRIQAEAKANAAEAMYDKAETTANSYSTMVENGDMTASQALLEMRNTIKDPRLQRAAMGSFSKLNQLKNMAQEEDAAKARSKASDDFDKAGGDINAMWKIYQNANKISLSETASKADKHYAKQSKALYDNAVQFSDPAIRSGSKPEAYEDVLGGIANGTYTSEAALKSSEQWPYLTSVGKKTALTTLKENQGFEMNEAKSLFKSWFREKHGREYSAMKDKGMMDDAMSFVQQRIQGSNRGKEPDYVQKALDLYVMSSTIPDSGKIWDDSGEYGRLNKQGKALPVIDETTRSDIETIFNKNIEVRNAFMIKYGNFNAAIRGYYKELKERELGPKINQQDLNYE